MARLIVDFHRLSFPTELPPSVDFFLDRDLLSGGADLSLSRAPAAPYLRHVDGQWHLVNASVAGTALTVFPNDQRLRFPVPARCAFALPDGESEIWVAKQEHRVLVVVSDSVVRLPGTRGASGHTTQIALPSAVCAVRSLFERKPQHKVVLAAHYREYFTPGITTPAPQHRDLTSACAGQQSNRRLERALDEVSEAIWGEPAGRRDEIPRFLISEALLLPHDQGLVPHRDCSHRTYGPAGPVG
jgi:hypothetical protein